MFVIRYRMDVQWIGDGQGPNTFPAGPKLQLGALNFAGLTVQNPQITIAGQPTGYIVVPGGDAPSQANFRTAMTGSSGAPTAGGMTADLDAAVATNLARIQGFATGGG